MRKIILLAFSLFTLTLLPENGNSQVSHFTVPGYDFIPISEDGNWHVLAEDFNGDGIEDLYITREAQDDILFFGNSNGSFNSINVQGLPWNNFIGSLDVHSADLNNDGINELLISRIPYTGGNSEVPGAKDKILLNLGGGMFADASSNLPTDFYNGLIPDMDAVNYTTAIATGYFNADTIPDIVMVNGGISYLPTLKLFNSMDGLVVLFPFIARDKLKNDLYFSSGTDLNLDGIDDYDKAPASNTVSAHQDMSTDVEVADFNGDGLDDLFISNFYDATIFNVMGIGDSSAYCKLYLNDTLNPGNFRLSVNFPALKLPVTSADVADFDKDGDIDLLLGIERRGDTLPNQLFSPSMTSKLFTNNGNAVFTDETQQRLPQFKKHYTSCFDIHFVDINNDGTHDIFGAGIHNYLFIQDSLSHSFYDATNLLPLFPARPDKLIPHTFHSYGVAFADFDNNGKEDLFLADTYEQLRLQLQLSNGQIRDTTTSNLPADGENTEYCIVGDLNGDSLQDIAKVNNGNMNSHALYLQSNQYNNYPYFSDKGVQIPLDSSFIKNYGIDQNDIDGDGDIDLLISGASGLSLFQNDGLGNFSLNLNWLSGISTFDHATRAKFVDINLDGYRDIFIPRAQALVIGVSNAILLWDSTVNQFTNASSALLPPNSNPSIDFDFADINQDGWMDLVVANDNASSLYLSNNGAPYSISNPFNLSNVRSIKFAQLDSDSLMDVIEVNKLRSDNAIIYKNDGTSIPFSGQTTIITDSEDETLDIGIYDFNSDGLNDLLIPLFHRETKIFINTGNMSFVDSSATYLPDSLYTVNSVKAVCFADINGDGLVDAYLSRDNQDLLLYGNNGITTNLQESNISRTVENVIAFPNPASTYLTLELKYAEEIALVLVYNNTGAVVLTVQDNHIQQRINIDHLSPGLYHVILYNCKSESYSTSFIKN